MSATFAPVYFTDENALGLGKLLRDQGRDAIRSVWIGSKRDLSPHDQVEIFVRHEARLRREVVKRGAGPWALALTGSGIRPMNLPGSG